MLRALWISLVFALGACAAQPVRVLAAGDFQPGGPIRDPLVGLPLQGELRVVNLESPLTARGSESGLDSDGKPVPGQTVRFAAPPERARWLRGRFEVATLANNHALDHGEAGRDDTARVLAAHGVSAAWREHDARLTVRGRMVTVIARDYPPRPRAGPSSRPARQSAPDHGPAERDAVAAPDLDSTRLDQAAPGDGPAERGTVAAPDLDSTRLDADAWLDDEHEVVDAVRTAARRGPVIVSLHWGHTGLSIPSAGQRRLAARLVDAGASAVIGHGPHTPQGVERRGRAVIAYSLGNLAFGCRCSEVTDALLLAFTIDTGGAARDVKLLPLRAGVRGPAALSDDAGLRELLTALSRDLGSTVRPTAGGLSVD